MICPAIFFYFFSGFLDNLTTTTFSTATCNELGLL